MTKYVKITSAIDGFRRGGIAHSTEPVIHEVSDFTREQLAQIEAEQTLVCVFFEKEDKTQSQPAQNGKSKGKAPKAAESKDDAVLYLE